MKKMSKLLLVITSFALVGASTLLGSCSGNNNSDIRIDDDALVKLTYTNIDLTLGESKLLGINISGGNVDTELILSVEDESIATITNTGLVTAHNFGKTEIKAKYGNSIAKCSVNVILGENIPVISLENIEERNVKIDLSTELELKPIIVYNNNSYDFMPLYELSDDSVGEMNENVFIPKSNGVEYITINGNFHGLKAIALTLEVIVQDNVIIFMRDEKNIEQNEVILYSFGGFGEEKYRTSFAPTFGVYVNETLIDDPFLDVDVINEENAVTYNPLTFEVMSTSNVGTAYYRIIYVDDFGNEYLKIFEIYNNKSLFTYKGDVIEVDSMGAKLPVEDIFDQFTDKEIESVTSLDGSVSYEVRDGLVMDLPVSVDSFGNISEQKFIVYNKSVGFKVNLRVFTKIIYQASDLEFFHIRTFDDKFPGYYVLNNDIDGDGFNLRAHTRTMGNAYLFYPNTGLTGTFDGRGHTISNISIGEGGIFGNVGKGGTIKNVGFKDIEIRSPSQAGGDDTPIIATYVNGCVFENVYISNPYIKAGYNAALVACNIMNNCLFVNCMFECFMEKESDIVSKNYGVLGSMCGERNSLPDGFANVYKDVVVNSNLPLIKSETNTSQGVNPYIVDTYPIELEGFASYVLKSGIIRFLDEEEMSKSGNDFESFSREYWEVNEHTLMWKSAR